MKAAKKLRRSSLPILQQFIDNYLAALNPPPPAGKDISLKMRAKTLSKIRAVTSHFTPSTRSMTSRQISQLACNIALLNSHVNSDSFQREARPSQVSPPHITPPSRSDLVEELAALLKDPSYKITLKPHSITCHVPSFSMKGLRIPASTITIGLKDLRIISVISAITTIRFVGPRSRSAQYHHPHVTGEDLCFGSAASPCQTALLNGQFISLFDNLLAAYRNYNHASPYIYLPFLSLSSLPKEDLSLILQWQKAYSNMDSFFDDDTRLSDSPNTPAGNLNFVFQCADTRWYYGLSLSNSLVPIGDSFTLASLNIEGFAHIFNPGEPDFWLNFYFPQIDIFEKLESWEPTPSFDFLSNAVPLIAHIRIELDSHLERFLSGHPLLDLLSHAYERLSWPQPITYFQVPSRPSLSVVTDPDELTALYQEALNDLQDPPNSVSQDATGNRVRRSRRSRSPS